MADAIVAERWLPVVGWEGVYEVSSAGRIRRILQVKGAAARLLTPTATLGYMRITLSHRRVSKERKIHHLVLEAFVGPATADKPECNHKNGNKADNRLENLEWCSRSENNLHAYRVLNKQPSGCAITSTGKNNFNAKLSDQSVSEMRRLYDKGGITQMALARMFGVNQTTVSCVLLRKTWMRVIN